MTRHKPPVTLDVWVGFGGMHPDENPRALRWANRFEAPMMLMALWIFIEWHMIGKGLISGSTTTVMDWGFWAFFAVETTLLASVATNPWRYLMRNWANVLIVVIGFPLWFELLHQVGMLRALRIVVLVGYLVHHVQVLRDVLARHHLGSTLLIGAFIVTMSGLLISIIDPAFKSPVDGIWWAWVSVTTVGYGDIVPVTTEGRIFAVLLILTGIVMISLVTANIAAYYFSQDTEKETRLEQESLRRIKRLEDHLERLESKLDQILINQKSPD
jgi:voltage-gated potassium channel